MLSVDVMDDAYFVCVGLCLSKEYRIYLLCRLSLDVKRFRAMGV